MIKGELPILFMSELMVLSVAQRTEPFITELALIWFLAGMTPLVDNEVSFFGE